MLYSLFKSLKLFLLVSCVLILNGCSLNKINQQISLIDQASLISGELKIETSLDASVYVQLHKKDKISIVLKEQQRLSNNNTYTFYTGVGQYLLFAYYDENHDQVFSKNEKGSYLSANHFLPFEINIKNKQNVKVPPLRIERSNLLS